MKHDVPCEPGKRWGRGTRWTTAERSVITGNPGTDARELMPLLPGRSLQAIRDALSKAAVKAREKPAVKQPGRYIETLAGYLTDEADALEIWLRWNGYVTCRVLSRDPAGWVTLLCTA